MIHQLRSAEATGALDEETENALYGSLMRACDCVVSVGATLSQAACHNRDTDSLPAIIPGC